MYIGPFLLPMNARGKSEMSGRTKGTTFLIRTRAISGVKEFRAQELNKTDVVPKQVKKKKIQINSH